MLKTAVQAVRLLCFGLLLGATDGRDFELPEPVRQLLSHGKWDSTPPSFRIIALSHIADGCVHQFRAKPEFKDEARACVEGVLQRALAMQPNQSGLFLSHLNLIYGDLDVLGPCADPAAHEKISQTLAKRSLEDPLRHAASYDSTSLRWPADQSVTLASLARFDAAHHASFLAEPLKQWKAVIEMHLDRATQLPQSEVTGKGVGAKNPRGCAQSYISRYLAEVDSSLASRWWAKYKAGFFVRMGPLVGFREWPKGVSHWADDDSGPIVYGIGTAASALALSAAKAQGDAALALQLEASAQAVISTGVGGKAAQTVLAQAITFEGRWHQLAPQPTH